MGTHSFIFFSKNRNMTKYLLKLQTLWPLFMDGVQLYSCRATTRKQLTFSSPEQGIQHPNHQNIALGISFADFKALLLMLSFTILTKKLQIKLLTSVSLKDKKYSRIFLFYRKFHICCPCGRIFFVQVSFLQSKS